MSDNPLAPDLLAMRLLADVPAGYRDQVAARLGAGDLVARHLPMHEVPRVVLAAWMTYAVIDAWQAGDRDLAKALDYVAGALVSDVGGRMALVAGIATGAPDTP